MWSDYRAFGICEKLLVATGAFTAEAGGFIHAKALAATPFTGLVLTFEQAGTTSDTAGTIPAGGELVGIKTITITSGQVELLFFKS